MDLWCFFSTCFAAVVLVSLTIYLLPLLYVQYLSSSQDLTKRYDTQWALVTGSSSGIGQSVATKLALQGFNVVLVALDDEKLSQTASDLASAFPELQFRAVGVDLSSDSSNYVNQIEKATADIDIGVVVNNAGFLYMGFFDEVDANTHRNVLSCNAWAAIHIAHYFYRRMIRNHRRGCLIFTSSSAWLLPSPFAIMYGATKALISSFAVSLAIEAEKHSVDVCVIHPCYTRTRLYDNSPKVAALDVLDKFAWTPDQVADAMLCAVGRVVSLDLGWYSIVSRLINNTVDLGFLARMFMPFRDAMAPKETKKPIKVT